MEEEKISAGSPASEAPAGEEKQDLASQILFAGAPVASKKKKKGTSGPSPRNLFVRNLALSTTSQSLEDFFSEIGPIKRCFIVADNDNQNLCAGYGFVHYAMESDARKAMKSLQGASLDGQNIIIERALPREPRNYVPKRQRVEEEGGEEAESDDEDMAPITAAPARKKVRAQLKFSDPVRVLVLSGDQIDQVAPNEFRKWVKAFRLGLNLSKIETASGRMYVTLSTDQQARSLQEAIRTQGTGPRGNTLDAEILAEAGKRSRLIVRNLSFQCPQKHLQNLFSPYGQVIEVSIPKKGADKNSLRSGFGFVQFLSYQEAEKAMTALNGTMIDKRPIAVDWALPKSTYIKHVLQSQHAATPADDTPTDTPMDEDPESSSDEDKAQNDDEDSSSSEAESDDEGSSSDDDESEEDEEEEEEEDVGSADVHRGETIFIRNLSFHSTTEAVEEQFMQWGDVAYVHIVKDPQTGRSHGTAFVKFKQREAVEKCLRAGYPHMKESEREGESRVQLDGRQLILSVAVDRKRARELAETEKKPKKKEDKRNLYLAYEGVITEQDEAASDLSRSDLAKRQRALAEKKAKLQNPNHFVSTTRLSVRNIPREYDEKMLRALFRKHAPPGAGFKQVKIVREGDRLDPQTGKPRSRGFGFVEFKEHEDALAALRAVNNNPKVWTKQSRPIVEFAVENAKALQKLRAIMDRGKVRASTDNEEGGYSRPPAKKRSRGNADTTEPSTEPPKKKARTQETSRGAQGQQKPAPSPKKSPENAKKGAARAVTPKPVKASSSSPRGPTKNVFAPAASTSQTRAPVRRQPPSAQAKAVKPPKKKRNQSDSFDKVVDDYKRKFTQVARGTSKKWYE